MNNIKNDLVYETEIKLTRVYRLLYGLRLIQYLPDTPRTIKIRKKTQGWNMLDFCFRTM